MWEQLSHCKVTYVLVVCQQDDYVDTKSLVQTLEVMFNTLTFYCSYSHKEVNPTNED